MSGDPGVVMKIIRNNELREQSLIDPVGKFRVCEPQTLIDTDFEYGLQTTKWETIELVNNIPTFYSRDNDEALTLSNVTTVADSYNIYVHTASNHGLIVGSPIIVQGVDSFSAEGSYVVNAVISSNQFVYKAKALQKVNGSIYDNISTQVYIGKLYQGTQYNLDALGYIRTDGTNQIIVDTLFPHGFSKDTSFILSKSIGQKQLVVANSNVDVADSFTTSNTIFTTSNNPVNTANPYVVDNVIVHKWIGKHTAFCDNADVNPNSGNSIITSSNHGLQNDEFVMYVPPPLTLSNIDAAYVDEDAARMPAISTFYGASMYSSSYNYSYDGTTNSIATGGNTMFSGGVNNAHFIGTGTSPTFQINYNTSNWTNLDANADYRTFGQSMPFCAVLRHANNAQYYWRIENNNIGAQSSTIHWRDGVYQNQINNMYISWNFFGLYNNGSRPSFTYLIASMNANGSYAWPNNNWYTGTGTGTAAWSSVNHTYRVSAGQSYNPSYTIVMLLSRTSGGQVGYSELWPIVNRIGNFFQSFTGIMGDYRLTNMHLYNYDNAGDTFINDGGNSMFDNNRLGNLLFIDNQPLSYRDRAFTTLPNTPNVDYKFISNCQPQIMFSRILEQRSVTYRISDTWAIGSGAVDGNWWYNMNVGTWFCSWGYYGVYNRSTRASVYRIFMAFNSANGSSYPSVSASFINSTSNPILNFTVTPWSASQYPTYVAVILLSQPNGGQVAQATFSNVVRHVLENSGITSTSWPLALPKLVQQLEYNEYNTIGGLRPMECYQVNTLDAHRFQLMSIPAWDAGTYWNFGEIYLTPYSNYWTSTYDYNIDITTNFFNFNCLVDNKSYVRYTNPYGNQYWGYAGFRFELWDENNNQVYVSSTYYVGGGGYYSGYWYFQDQSLMMGNVDHAVRRFTRFRVFAVNWNYSGDSCVIRFNDIIPVMRYPPLWRPVMSLNQGNAREYVGRHAFKKVYRVHYFANVGNPASTNYYLNFARRPGDIMSIENSDSVCMFQHPELLNIENMGSSRSTVNNSRTIMPDWNGSLKGGPGIPRTNTASPNMIPSNDNLKNGNSTRYWLRPGEQNVYSSYAAIRLQGVNNINGTTTGTVFSNNNLRWWPGTSWIVFVRDIAERNSITMMNHGLTNNTSLQIENISGQGIREIPAGTYFADVLNQHMFRLKANISTTATLDMSAFDASALRVFYSAVNPNRDTFLVRDHGLFEGTPMVYTSSNVIFPLVNTRTYLATNVTRDRFSLFDTTTNARVNLAGTQLFEDVSTINAIGQGNVVQTINNCTYATSGTGTGSAGGFATPNGLRYILFNGTGLREVITKNMNASDASTFSVLVIRGTGTNGGDAPETGDELWLSYSVDLGASWIDLSVVANTTAAPTWTTLNVSIAGLSTGTRSSIVFRLYQKANSGVNTDMYGIQIIRIDNNVSLTPTDIHYFAIGGIGAVDGTYVTSAVTNNSTILTLQAPFNVPPKTLFIVPANVLNFKDNTFYYPNHSMRTGALIQYQANGNTPLSPLIDNVQYFAIRVDENHFRLATTYANAVANTSLTMAVVISTVTHILLDYSVGGETVSTSTVSGTAGQTLVTGAIDSLTRTPLTQFASEFRIGNFMNIIINDPAYDDYNVTGVNTGTNTLTFRRIDGGSSVMLFVTGDALVYGPSVSRRGQTFTNNITNLTVGRIYYANVSGNNIRLFNTVADAVAATNIVTLGGGSSGLFTSLRPSTILTRKIVDIRNNRFMSVDNAHNISFSGARYLMSTNLFVKADGFAMHRPYDGGVELIPPKNSDSQMIRQTRKYFRYQSGKGIQVSLAINFSSPVDIDRLTRSGGLATLTTKRPHRLSPGISFTVEGCNESEWNGTYTVIDITSDISFTFNLNIIPTSLVAPGNMTFHLNGWNNSFLRCGLYDDQNGMFYEYDGSMLFTVRRSSTLQISGTSIVTFNSPVVTGLLTAFTSQVAVNDMIVIKGMSYKIVSIESDTRLFIQPVYRGITRDGVIITKTTDLRIPRTQWTIDKCDGTGPTGFNLNINRIQMAYMDYSWYGAGKVRFGFKDINGEVRYMNEFVHNNRLNEAYLRSGNLPCRYEVYNRGFPTYTPALMHWGTSVIMDGKFDDDKAYLFTAAGQVLSYSGSDIVTVGSIASRNNAGWFANPNNFNSPILVYDNTTRTNVTAYIIYTTGANFSIVQNIRSGTPVTSNGGFLQADTVTVSQPMRFNTTSSFGTVIFVNRPPTQAFTNDTINIGFQNDSVPPTIPLITIRLAPSVDNSRPGVLGAREIMNRMQLILKNVGILTTHDCEIRLLLNGSIDNKTWQRVTPPSLSQLVYHGKGDSLENGTQIFNFRIPGGSADSTGKRSALSTTYDLNELVTLGNSILGGDGIFPDGPDVLTICASILDLTGISSQTPLIITGRVTWTESQA